MQPLNVTFGGSSLQNETKQKIYIELYELTEPDLNQVGFV